MQSKLDNILVANFFSGEQLDQFLYGGGKDAPFAVDEGEGSAEVLVFELNDLEQVLGFFAGNGGLGKDGDTGVYFDSAFHCFNVVEFHNEFGVDVEFTEDAVGGFAGGDIGLEADEFMSVEAGDIDAGFFGEGMLGAGSEDEGVVVEREDFELFVFFGISDEPKVDGVVEDILVYHIGAPVFHTDVYLGILREKDFNVGGQFVKPDTVDGGNVDGAADFLSHFLKLAVEGLVKAEHFLGGTVEFFTFVGEAELFLATVNNEHLEMFFHAAQLLTDRGLSDPVKFGGSRKTFALH